MEFWLYGSAVIVWLVGVVAIFIPWWARRKITMYLLAIAVMFLGVSHPFILINFGVEPKIESWAGVGYFWAFVVTAPGIVLFILSFLSATIALNVNAHKIYKLKRIEK